MQNIGLLVLSNFLMLPVLINHTVIIIIIISYNFSFTETNYLES